MLKALFPALAVTVLCAHPAFAVEDSATGLKVELSDDFIVEVAPFPVTPQYDVLIGVNAASGQPPIVGNSDYLCGVAFVTAPQNAKLSQAEINAMIDTPEWGMQARAAMEALMTFSTTEPFQLGDATGAEFVATPKIGPDHDNVRLVLSLVETPKGRTVVTCTATASTLKKAMPVFRTIRDGVTPPR